MLYIQYNREGKRVCSRLAAVGVGWKIYGFEEKNSKDSKKFELWEVGCGRFKA